MSKKTTAKLIADTLYNYGKAEQVQCTQIFDVQEEVQEIKDGLDDLEQLQNENSVDGKLLISELESLLKSVEKNDFTNNSINLIDRYIEDYLNDVEDLSTTKKYDIKKTKEIITHNDWEYYFNKVIMYADEKGIEDIDDPYLSLLGEQQYLKLKEEIDDEFSKKTSIVNAIDLKFLIIAIALELSKGLIFPIVANHLEYGKSFDPKDRMDHNDKSIEKTHKAANDKYRDSHSNDNNKGKWIEFLYQTVLYDITAGTGNIPDINLHGGFHRLYTLGHDPILGWLFGTANIMTDVITIAPGAIVQGEEKLSKLKNILGIKSYKVQRKPKMLILPEQVSTSKMFMDCYNVAREHPLNLPAAVFAEAQHLKSDVGTKMGLPIPLLEVFNPELASKLYANNYDALCFARDVDIVGKSATISLMINMLIGLIHGLYYDSRKDGTRELYEVRTRKILLIANTIGTSSNLIFSFCTQNINAMDIGGLFVTLSHLLLDPVFFVKIKKEFLENRIYEKIENEINELNRIEAELIEYGEKHRALYD